LLGNNPLLKTSYDKSAAIGIGITIERQKPRMMSPGLLITFREGPLSRAIGRFGALAVSILPVAVFVPTKKRHV
jgi:hypothetical protein